MSFLDLEGKNVLVMGVANRKSVAAHVAKRLVSQGARVILSVRSEDLLPVVAKLFPDRPALVCDVERAGDIAALAAGVGEHASSLAGLVHSIAYADYSRGMQPFHQTPREAFLQAMDISCYSLIAVSNALADLFEPEASVVTISISTTTMAAENYGYMAPVKAALDSSMVFLAKSFSAFSRVRFNAVRAGLLKTSASAGIPGYLDSYIHAETATLRKQAVATGEVADTVLFLLSPASSGINAQGIVVDAGMGVNLFDKDIVRRVAGTQPPPGD